MHESPLEPYDALLLVSYGGPDGPDDVLPFLRNATGGAGIPDSRLEQVGGHYHLFGGVSPLNARNRELLAALQDRLGDSIDYAIGNRNWHPFFTEALTDLADRGARRILTLFTSAYTSYSGCRQYRENLYTALEELRSLRPEVELRLDRVRPFANTPGFISANASAIAAGATEFENLDNTHLVFVTHSIPLDMARRSGAHPDAATPSKPALFDDREHPRGMEVRQPDLPAAALTGLLPVTQNQDVLGQGWGYLAQHLSVAHALNLRLKAQGIALPWSLAFCSRSGPPQAKWLEPDINDHLKDLAAAGVKQVIVSPFGFISDHMEVVYDLDTEAQQTADALGLGYRRVATAGSDPVFLDTLADLVRERAALARGETPRLVTELGTFGPLGENCGAGCCQYQNIHTQKNH